MAVYDKEQVCRTTKYLLRIKNINDFILNISKKCYSYFMKYLITGAAGFIGINFLEFMIETNKNDKFVVVDKLTYAANICHLNELINQYENITFYKEDITKNKAIKKIFEIERPNIVINFAAETHVDRSIYNSDKFVKTNVLGTNVLLEASKNYSVNRYVQISTDEVYGSLNKGNLNVKKEFYTSDLLNPTNPYSATKASADLLTLSYFKTYKLPIIIIRMTNNFGPYQNKEKMIPKIILNALQNHKIPIYGDGSNQRDWLYVKDSAKAISIILEKGEIGRIYHISTHNLITNIELVNRILKKLDIKDNLIQYVEDRPAHDYAYSLNTDETEKLGFVSKNNFDKNIEETIEFYKKTSKRI